MLMNSGGASCFSGPIRLIQRPAWSSLKEDGGGGARSQQGREEEDAEAGVKVKTGPLVPVYKGK